MLSVHTFVNPLCLFASDGTLYDLWKLYVKDQQVALVIRTQRIMAQIG